MRFDITLESRNQEYLVTAGALSGEWYNDQTTGSDGTDNYFLDQRWPSWEARKQNQGYKEIGTVSDGTFPQNAISVVQLAWLAFCSGSTFHAGTNAVGIQLHSTKYAPTNGILEIVSFKDPDSQVIKTIRCIGPAALDAGNKKIDLKAPYDQGYLLWELNVTAYTNLGKLTVPVAFEYAQYYPKVKDGATKDDLTCVFRGEFEATNVTATVPAQKLLPVAKQANVPVYDWRFNLGHVGTNAAATPIVTYTLNGDAWRGRENSEIQGQVVAIRHEIHVPPPSSPRRVKVLSYTIFVTSFLLLCWWIRREVKARTTP